MKKGQLNNNNNQSTINLQTTCEAKLKTFRTTLKRELLEFENQQRENDPYFDVYVYLSNKLGYNETTIRKWMNEFDETGTKIGLRDLELMCIYINSFRPAEAFIYELKQHFKTTHLVIAKITTEELKSAGLKTSGIVGLLCEAIVNALDDGELDRAEKHNLSRIIENLEKILAEIKSQIK